MRAEINPSEMKSEEQRHRVQLDFSAQAYEKLVELRKKSDLKSNAEVVRNALRLYEWFLQQKREGYALQIVRNDEAKEIEFVF
jgi:hypothetical protein